MGKMRGVDAFAGLWKRREEIDLPQVGKVAVMGLSDLVRAKKTQRDKDWPMIRRLIEADIYNTSANPSQKKIRFWLAECRTPELLISLAAKYPEDASNVASDRSLLRSAIEGNQRKIQDLLRQEEDKEKDLDRQYWDTLKSELQAWRRRIDKRRGQR